MKKITIPISIIFFCFLAFSSINQALAVDFNPNNIISDQEILDSKAMSLKEIQTFLEEKNSFLATYQGPDFEGNIRKASEIIYNAADNNYDCDDASDLSSNPTKDEKEQKCRKVSINPKFLLVLLQKEQSLVENSTPPTPRQLDWAVGYGCPDSAACGERWRGFGKQVNSAALQFFDYIIHPNYYTYKAGGTYTFSNPYSTTHQGTNQVTPENQATAALYNYTPHVYNGNYNFWKIWQRWFTRFYPDGTLLQSKADGGIWLIQKGKKRPFASKGALTSRYDLTKVISVNHSDLEKYEKGKTIKFPQYALLKSPKGGIYLLIDDIKHPIKNQKIFKNLGFNPEEVVSATQEELADFADGSQITATSTYPFGTLAQDKKTGGIFWIMDDTKAPLWDKVLLKTKFRNKRIVKMTSKELDKYKTIAPVKFNDGELLKTTNSLAVYIIANGKKRSFSSGKIFEKMGYRWDNVIEVSPKLISLYENGDPIIRQNETAVAKSTSTMPVSTSTAITIAPNASSSPTSTNQFSTSTVIATTSPISKSPNKLTISSK